MGQVCHSLKVSDVRQSPIASFMNSRMVTPCLLQTSYQASKGEEKVNGYPSSWAPWASSQVGQTGSSYGYGEGDEEMQGALRCTREVSQRMMLLNAI